MELYNNGNQLTYLYNNCEPAAQIYNGCYQPHQMVNYCTDEMPIVDGVNVVPNSFSTYNAYNTYTRNPQLAVNACQSYGAGMNSQYMMASQSNQNPLLMSNYQPMQSSTPEISSSQSCCEVENTDSIQEMEEHNPNFHMCTICFADFGSVEEVLRHELLIHSQQQHRSVRPMRNIVNSVTRAFNSNSQQQFRNMIYLALNNCEPNDALTTLLLYYTLDYNKLNDNYNMVLSSLQQILTPLGHFTIHLFGSYANSLCLKDSDLDFFIQEHSFALKTAHRTINTYNKIYKALKSQKEYSEVIFIRSARVPIIRAVHVKTSCSVDLNLSNNNCMFNSNFVRDVIQFDERIRNMALFLKIWAKQNQIIGRGHMSSYCFINLILFFLQSEHEEYEQILPSMQTLQNNVEPIMANCINYAYNLNGRINPLPTCFTATSLVKGFYRFYQGFEFSKFIIAPHIGQKLPIGTINDPEFIYVNYHQQLTDLNSSYPSTGAPLKLDIDHCMVVQDIFCLTYNLARSVNESLLEFFSLCINQAYQFCSTLGDDEPELYKKLLFDTGNRLSLSRPTTGAFSNASQAYELSYMFQRSNAETRAVTGWFGGFPKEKSIHRLWSKCYIEIIYDILTKIYLLNIEPNPGDEVFKSINENDNNEPICTELIWYISGQIDLWTSRVLTKNGNCTFMDYHLRQTKELMKERANNKFYIQPFKAKMILRIKSENHSIQISIMRQPVKSITKKDRMRKLFSVLKANIQNYNFREKLEEHATNQRIKESENVKKPIIENNTTDTIDNNTTNVNDNNNDNNSNSYINNNKSSIKNHINEDPEIEVNIPAVEHTDKCLQINMKNYVESK